MSKAPLVAFCLAGLLSVCPLTFAADAVDSPVPSTDSSGPNNPTPPTLPTPGTGADQGTGTGIDGGDKAPTPGTDGTGREESKDNPGGNGSGTSKHGANSGSVKSPSAGG